MPPQLIDTWITLHITKNACSVEQSMPGLQYVEDWLKASIPRERRVGKQVLRVRYEMIALMSQVLERELIRA